MKANFFILTKLNVYRYEMLIEKKKATSKIQISPLIFIITDLFLYNNIYKKCVYENKLEI